ncbi:uncharacterized protein LOC119689633 [Teleopsis dalmanni]|uniref:uncharacterized protein LOC119689633 n=1 Tax=Teleopsis dalmanni TaxID=139649 RepID=UPI0018CFB3E6|nr:uncharacterized protein LOC119689633 [Teleopsis dalmanni]
MARVFIQILSLISTITIFSLWVYIRSPKYIKHTLEQIFINNDYRRLIFDVHTHLILAGLLLLFSICNAIIVIIYDIVCREEEEDESEDEDDPDEIELPKILRFPDHNLN